MTDIHAVRIVTYESRNADAGKEWLAYLILPSGRLPLAFFAETEADALGEAQALWDSEREAREANHHRREELRRKAEERKARKEAA